MRCRKDENNKRELVHLTGIVLAIREVYENKHSKKVFDIWLEQSFLDGSSEYLKGVSENNIFVKNSICGETLDDQDNMGGNQAFIDN